ncbi:MAG: ketosteroid isomerase-related protein [Methylococcales bacterium]
MNSEIIKLIEDYYAAFNRGDMNQFIGMLSDDVVHDINQGSREVGKTAFANFMKRMNRNYREELVDVVVMSNFDGSRAAAEFVVLGEYLQSDEGLPAARGQHYRLLAGAFFEVRNGRIARVTNYYNLGDWIAQVS